VLSNYVVQIRREENTTTTADIPNNNTVSTLLQNSASFTVRLNIEN